MAKGEDTEDEWEHYSPVVESILKMGEPCPLIFKSWFVSELEAGWNKIIRLGRDFTRVVYDNEMVMSLGVNSRSAQCLLP